MPSGHLPVVTQFVPYMHICYGTRHLLQEGHKLNRAGLSPSLVLARKKVSAQQQQQHPAAAAACFGFSMAWDGWQSVAGEPVSRGDAGPLAVGGLRKTLWRVRELQRRCGWGRVGGGGI